MNVRLNLDLDVQQVNLGNALKYVVKGHLTIITTNVMMGTIRMVMVVINHANLKRVSSVLVEVQILMISAKRFVEMALTWAL
jgi:hypothetical protein